MKSIHRIAGLLLAVFLFIGINAANINAVNRELKKGIGFVAASSLRLRSEPNNTSKTLGYASSDEVVVILSKSGAWYHVNYNKKTGYMHENYLDYFTREDAELGYGNVNGSDVRLRSGPSTGSSTLTKLAKNSKVYIIGINNQWFKVIYDDYIGYIRSDYVDLTEIPYENKSSDNPPLFFRRGESTGTAPSPEALKEQSSVKASQIISTAKKYIGVPYLWGGTSTKGFDCSGYVQYVFRAHGITLPRTSKEQYKVGFAVSKSNLKPGDLVFFNTSGSGVSHLGIYLGNNEFIHASSSKGVTISSLSNSYWSARYIGARRIL